MIFSLAGLLFAGCLADLNALSQVSPLSLNGYEFGHAVSPAHTGRATAPNINFSYPVWHIFCVAFIINLQPERSTFEARDIFRQHESALPWVNDLGVGHSSSAHVRRELYRLYGPNHHLARNAVTILSTSSCRCQKENYQLSGKLSMRQLVSMSLCPSVLQRR
jgi:hypothetical protein